MLDQIDIELIVKIAIEAGDAILEIYKQDFEVEYKADESPLTSADKASNEVIVEALKKAYPSIPILSEENKVLDYSERKNWEYCWVVDPLDGTKEFIKKNGEFTVNIALVHNNYPVLGVIHIPVQEKTFYGIENKGSFVKTDGDWTKIEKRQPNKEKLLVVASRSHLNEDTSQYVDGLRSHFDDVEFVSAGSSLKFCLVAEGLADQYPRFAPTMEWDTAAGQIIAEQAGATVVIANTSERVNYNKENLLNPYFLVK
ncbi:UNVERIFIED_CONTAM: hypothetical protein GTU68_036029 [Idotea baltica]|nr:hypothetical protein [Idotea baltica]